MNVKVIIYGFIILCLVGVLFFTMPLENVIKKGVVSKCGVTKWKIMKMN